MKILLHIVHATPSVLPLYQAAMAKAGLDVDIVTVLPREAELGGRSSAYANLCSRWRAEGRTPIEGLRAYYPGPSTHYGAWVIASWSAGYKLLELALQHHDSAAIDGIVMLDSGHAAFDPDHTAADRQLKPFVEFAKRAMAGYGLLWVAHTDVGTPQTGPGAFASTTQWTAELVRLLGLGTAPKKPGELLATPGFMIDVHDDKAPNEAKAEHIGALRDWGPSFSARAIEWLVISRSNPITQPSPCTKPKRSLGEVALDIALAELNAGVKEEPLGSNDSDRIRAYLGGCVRHGRLLLLRKVPWCAAFLGWCDAMARAELRLDGRDEVPPCKWRAAVSELCADARKVGALIPWPTNDIRPGDRLILQRNGQDPTLGGEGHLGIVESFDAETVTTIDGNYENRVARPTRLRSDPSIVALIRYSR